MAEPTTRRLSEEEKAALDRKIAELQSQVSRPPKNPFDKFVWHDGEIEIERAETEEDGNN